jgi:hypothetical protein
MKPALLVVSIGTALIAGRGARADDPPPATLAVSREGTLYAIGNTRDTLAVSREGTVYTITGPPATLAVSREGTIYLPPGAVATLAVSREGTVYTNYSLRNVAAAMRIAAGLSTPTAREMEFYNLISADTSNGVVDLLDVVAVARRADHPYRGAPVPVDRVRERGCMSRRWRENAVVRGMHAPAAGLRPRRP